MKLRVTYERPQDVIRDHDQQFARGGLLVQVAPPPNLEQRSAIELEIVTSTGAAVLTGEALQVFPGVGVAVGFDPASPALKALVYSARSAAPAASADGAPPHHSLVVAGAESPKPPTSTSVKTAEPSTAPTGDPKTRIKSASIAEKMRIAQHGTKDERAVIMRDPAAQNLHRFVIRNPHLQLDEVCQIARMATTTGEIFTYIASQPDWARRPEVALALVRNPKVPVSLAVKMLNHIPAADIRQLAKAPNVRDAIQRAARRKIM